MLHAAAADLAGHGRGVFGVAPSAKAAQVLARETGIRTDTVAKLLCEWERPDGPRPEWRLSRATTLVVDEAGMLGTNDLYQLAQLTAASGWRLALVGDTRQLQAVGRGGLFGEICASSRVIELERVHRFTHPWEAAASLRLRHGDPRALDTYCAHHRIVAGTLDDHLDVIARLWLDHHRDGTTLAITTTTNEHVDLVNHHIQRQRIDDGELNPSRVTVIADGTALVGDIVTTRRNQRDLETSSGGMVRNRDRWTVTAIDDGVVTAQRLDRDGTVALPADYVREHVRLGYAATEPGNQGDTCTASVTLATSASTGRGLYVGMTRGREANHVCVITDTGGLDEARDILDTILTIDRADTPAVTQRRDLAQQDRRPAARPDRCQVPDWYPDHRDDASAAYRHARAALEDSQDRRRDLTRRVESCRDAFDIANQRCAPYDARITVARRACAHARAQRGAATTAFDASGLRGRRRARGALDDANQRVDEADDRLAREERNAAAPNRAREDARQSYQTARDELRTHDRIAHWNHLPERLAAAEHRIDALDTWHRWATGGTARQADLVATVDLLSTSDDGADNSLAELAHRWARSQGIGLDPPHPSVALTRVEPSGMEIDL